MMRRQEKRIRGVDAVMPSLLLSPKYLTIFHLRKYPSSIHIGEVNEGIFQVVESKKLDRQQEAGVKHYGMVWHERLCMTLTVLCYHA